MKIWKVLYTKASGNTAVAICKADNIQKALIEFGCNLSSPKHKYDAIEKAVVTQIKNAQQLED